jgi:hypothetical protein
MLKRYLWLFPLLVASGGCATGGIPIPESWLSVPQARPVATGTLLMRPDPVSAEGNRIVFNGKALTDAFTAVDSADLSEARQEIAFSVKRKESDNFDIGLVATEGSAISWVPAEPVDEVHVKWAPKGNKISYIVRAAGGDLVRTLHIPTAVQLAVDFPYAKVDSLVWEGPAGEKFTVAYSTPDASGRMEEMHYGGEERRITFPPAVRLDAEVEPIGSDAVVLRRRDLTYGERVPAVIWVDREPYAWSDARAALFRGARVAIVVTRTAPDDELWQTLAERPWLDTKRAYVVGADAKNATVIRGDAKVRKGRYLQKGSLVTVAPAVVQSFAARFIADDLKRNPPTNGSSR